VGRDDQGLYLLVALVPGEEPEKMYLEELFEDYVGRPLALHLDDLPKSVGDFLHSDVPRDQLKQIMQHLDLQTVYHHVAPEDNILNWILAQVPEQPAMMCRSRSLAEHAAWQETARAQLEQLVRLPLPGCPPNVQEGPEAELKHVTLRRVSIYSTPGLRIPAILAYPAGLSEPRPAVVCLHGHNFGKINTLGFEHSASDSYYGFELAQRGFVTLSLDQYGWGERMGRHRHHFKSEASYALSTLQAGRTAIGVRSWDVSRALDYLSTLPIVDPSRFATIGQSGGGTTSLYAAALDPRVTAAVVSGYFCSYRWSILTINHCPCNYVPGLAQEFDCADIGALIAPRPLFIVSGDSDGIFPQEGVQDAYHKLRDIYSALGAADALDIDVLEKTGHKFSGRRAYPWLERQLGI
jgi:dienelactone hydrolase